MTLIAVSCAYDDDKDRAMLHMGYVRSLVKAGATPIMVYMDGPNYRLPKVDGLVLSGGGDISPIFFSKKPTENTGKIQFERDMFEMSLMEQCIDMPVLGICRGMQVLNTAYGGTLYDDIPNHDLKIYERHEIAVYENSRLEPIIGSRIYGVNSMHHQSVHMPGYGLRVSAVSEDGIIEAIEHPLKPHFGVQWHPEKMGDSASGRLFDFFVKLCQRKG